ncbi:MAG TPA: hypothetical protein VJZ71_10435 [Phycisphaerae bacterium]|nr:hypothetical protein [Phycisphaerae bacterium]
MKTARLIRASAVLSVLLIAGCDTVVIMLNSSSSGVFLLAPGEEAGFVDLLEPGNRREAEVAPGLTTFTALNEDGQVLDTQECTVPPADEGPTVSPETLVVTWTGSEITCELVSIDPESAGGGTAGRFIPRGIFWPPSP